VRAATGQTVWHRHPTNCQAMEVTLLNTKKLQHSSNTSCEEVTSYDMQDWQLTAPCMPWAANQHKK
jgi:hypothetical protein